MIDPESPEILPQIDPKRIQQVIEENEGLFLMTFSFPVAQVYPMFREELAQVASHFDPGIRFGEVLVAEDPTLVRQFELTSFPTLLLFHEAAEVERVEQFWTPEPLIEYLELARSFYS